MKATAAVRVVWRAAQVLYDHWAKDDEELREALETLDAAATADEPMAFLALNGMDLRTVLRAVKQHHKKIESAAKKSEFVPQPGHCDVNRLKLSRFPVIEAEILRALKEVDRAEAVQSKGE